MLDTTFTEIACANAATVPECRTERVGRARLGVHGARLLDELHRPITSLMTSAWARAMAASPQRTIENYAETRGVELERVEAAVDEFLTDRSARGQS